MRGALQLDGVLAVDVRPGQRDFTATYDPRTASVAQMLAALHAAREPAEFVFPPGAHDVDYVVAVDRVQAERPSRLEHHARIAPADELGTPLCLRGRLFDADGETPVADAVVFAYHTDREGRYDRPGSGPHSWRLRGWARTDAQGSFAFDTIRPGAYPSRREPAHVHFTVFTATGRFHAGVVQFADDPLVTAEHREAARRDGRFGAVRDVRKDGDAEHVEFALRLDRTNRF
ncbi:MAG TPA: hypothetical protein VK081_06595 [Planctomycetota bacterium]|nr:hypothetical protein [Planctomycetota bacterium]